MIFIGRYLVPGVARFPGVSTVGGIIGQCYGRSARLLTGVFSFICCAGVVGAQMEARAWSFTCCWGWISTWASSSAAGSCALQSPPFGGCSR